MLRLCQDGVVVVTGGTSGVGEAIARTVAREGAVGIVVAGRDRERGAAVAAALAGPNCSAEFVPAHLEDPDDCRAVVRRAVERFGRVDALVNSAADTARSTLDETTPAFFDRMMAVNVRAPMLTMQEAIRDMRRRRAPGAIVNILSTSAHGGQPHLCAYSTSKGALATLTRNVAHAHRRDRIRVNGLCLGWTDTPHEDRVQRSFHGRAPGWLAEAEAATPMGRLVKPAEVAEMVALLLSDRVGVVTGSLVEFSQDVLGGAD
ncbi:SDR family oxidoreductase [Plantactinospora sp. BC1]|uniref:SDR family oxidoreductase n=1 Tax=Plantactinospora sp. BC1 TaxID=2108470 RepID=UPI0018FEA100|nr:SDR family oxidoreductase [Plantactinospora sp. BC1]